MTASTACAAPRCIVGVTWLYKSSVTAICEWSSVSETTLGMNIATVHEGRGGVTEIVKPDRPPLRLPLGAARTSV